MDQFVRSVIPEILYRESPLILLLFAATCAASDPTLISVKHSTHTTFVGDSFNPSLSADGRTIAFESRARLTDDDKNRVRDIYVLNTRTNEMRRVPPPSDVKLNSGPSVSRDGTLIAFHVYSRAVPSKYPRTSDIYIYSMGDASISPLFPVARADMKGAEELFPALSRNNDTVVFTANSDARVRQVYTASRDGVLTLVSRAASGEAGNRPSGLARLSADGAVCVFLSAATNLDGKLPVTSLSMHLFLADLAENKVVRLDTFERGFDNREWMTGAFDINDDADVVVFEARHRSASNPFATLASSDLFVYDALQQKNSLMTEGLFSDASRNPSLSGDGRFVSFILVGNKQNRLVVYDRIHTSWKEAAVGEIDNPVLSKNGCMLAFERQDIKIRNIYTVPNPFMENDHACD
jgi:Tol biopolymer transport system component